MIKGDKVLVILFRYLLGIGSLFQGLTGNIHGIAFFLGCLLLGNIPGCGCRHVVGLMRLRIDMGGVAYQKMW